MRVVAPPPSLAADPAFHAWAQAVQQPSGVRAEAAAYQAVVTDGLITVDANSAPVTVTLPPAADQPNCEISVKKTDASANAVTVDGYSTETIDGSATYSLTTQYQSVTVKSNGTAWWIV